MGRTSTDRLRVFYSRQEAFDWMRKVAEENEVHHSVIDSDDDLYETMKDHFKIEVEDWSTVEEDPSIYGLWDEASRRVIIDHNFSRLTQERWEKLKKQIYFPRVEERSNAYEESLE